MNENIAVFCFSQNRYTLLVVEERLTRSDRPLTHSNHVTSGKRADTLICHTTMCRNSINFLYNSGQVTLWCVEVGPVANARECSTQEHDRARMSPLSDTC